MRKKSSSSRPAPLFPTRPLRQPRLLVVGCGDVGQRVLRLLRGRMRAVVLTSTAEKKTALRALGVRVLEGNLDQPQSLRRLAGLADRVLHAAPPARTDAHVREHRTAHLLNALARVRRDRKNRSDSSLRSIGSATLRLVYISTTGVYGNRDGGWVDESTTLHPRTGRAQRRLRAERSLRTCGLRGVADSVDSAGRPQAGKRFFSSSILRAPGIYAADRAHGTPRARLERGVPALRQEDDVFTNRIHANDLARACMLALFRGRAQRVYNVCDDAQIKAGDFLTQAAALYGLPAPERVSKAEMAQRVSPLSMSFLSESRRIRNHRLRELGLQLHYPHPLDEVKASVQ